MTTPNRESSGRLRVITTSILLGLALDICAFVMALPGDGSYVFFGLFSAPFSLIGFLLYFFDVPGVLVSILGIPLLAFAAGILGIIGSGTKKRWLLGLFLLVHYASAIIVLLTEPYGNWRRLLEEWNSPGLRLIILVALGIYLFGQAWLLSKFLKCRAAIQKSRPNETSMGTVQEPSRSTKR